MQKAAQRGEFMARYEGYCDETYQLFNSQDPSTEGFTRGEWQIYWGRMQAKYRELAAAEGIEV